eukprot:3103675-Rhodomonas_salina.3
MSVFPTSEASTRVASEESAQDAGGGREGRAGHRPGAIRGWSSTRESVCARLVICQRDPAPSSPLPHPPTPSRIAPSSSVCGVCALLFTAFMLTKHWYLAR